MKIAATAVYLLKQIPNDTIRTKTPYHQLSGEDENLSYLCAIGARAFLHQQQHTGKLIEKAWEESLVAYDHDSPTYQILDSSTRNVVRSGNATFLETLASSLDSYQS